MSHALKTAQEPKIDYLNSPQGFDVLPTSQRRRRWSLSEKLKLLEEAEQSGSSISLVARRYHVAPSQLFAWRKLMLEGGEAAIRADEGVVPASKAKELEGKVRELERILGRKTLEVEMLKEALSLATQKKKAGVMLMSSHPASPLSPVNLPNTRDTK
jgi:transposase